MYCCVSAMSSVMNRLSEILGLRTIPLRRLMTLLSTDTQGGHFKIRVMKLRDGRANVNLFRGVASDLRVSALQTAGHAGNIVRGWTGRVQLTDRPERCQKDEHEEGDEVVGSSSVGDEPAAEEATGVSGSVIEIVSKEERRLTRLGEYIEQVRHKAKHLSL